MHRERERERERHTHTYMHTYTHTHTQTHTRTNTHKAVLSERAVVLYLTSDSGDDVSDLSHSLCLLSRNFMEVLPTAPFSSTNYYTYIERGHRNFMEVYTGRILNI